MERKHQILRAASQEFRQRGFHRTGMRDIARQLGMTVGNLYYYFENKQELLAFCQEETMDRLLEIARWVREQPLRADAKLILGAVGHVRCLNEEHPGSLAHLEVEEVGAPRRNSLMARRDEYEAFYRAVIEEGMRDGVFRSVDAKVTSLAILGALNWTVKWYRPDGERSAFEIGGTFADFFVRGLLAPGVELEEPEVVVPASMDSSSPASTS